MLTSSRSPPIIMRKRSECKPMRTTMTMASMPSSKALTAGLLLLLQLLSSSHAFTPASMMSKAALTNKNVAWQHHLQQQLQQRQQRMMATTDEDKSETTKDTEPYFVKSVLKKQMAYDEKAGRFFESSVNEEDCIPDEEFCVTDKATGDYIRLTQPEKERIFLDALQAYYSSGRKVLSDEEFDLLKEDLTWNGSPVVVMNRKEGMYMKAMQDYLKGTPSMSDTEFDALKAELKEDGSKFAVDTEPKCFIDTGICKVTMEVDFFRSNLLYLPAGLAITIVWLGLAYELIEPLIRINPIFLLLAGTPIIYSGSKFITEELVFVNNKIARGPCPACSYTNVVYFGDILGVEGFTDVAEVKCPNCKETFNVQRNTLRASTMPKL